MLKNKIKKWAAATALAVVSVMGISACSADGTDNGSEGELTVVRYGYLPVLNAPVYLAEAKELYKKHGVDLQFIKFGSGPEVYSALRSNSVDIADFSTTSFVTGLASSLDIQAFGVIYDLGPTDVLVTQADQNINSAQDLKGKRVASVTGTSAYAGLLSYLAANNMTIEDIDYLNMQVNAIQPAFTHGDIDATYIYAPASSVLLSQGGQRLTDNAQAGFDGFELFVGRTQWLAENPEVAAAIIRATEEGRLEVMKSENLDEVVNILHDWTGIDKDSLPALVESTPFPSYAEFSSESSKYSLVSPDGVLKVLQDTAQLYFDQGFVDPVDGFDEILKKSIANKELILSAK